MELCAEEEVHEQQLSHCVQQIPGWGRGSKLGFKKCLNILVVEFFSEKIIVFSIEYIKKKNIC